MIRATAGTAPPRMAHVQVTPTRFPKSPDPRRRGVCAPRVRRGGPGAHAAPCRMGCRPQAVLVRGGWPLRREVARYEWLREEVARTVLRGRLAAMRPHYPAGTVWWAGGQGSRAAPAWSAGRRSGWCGAPDIDLAVVDDGGSQDTAQRRTASSSITAPSPGRPGTPRQPA